MVEKISAAAIDVDTIVIGAGFYGCEIALQMKRLGHERVVLAENRPGILERASFVNQARIHNGYHYPRSIPTALRSHVNFERFVEVYRHAVLFDMTMIYAIAKGSRVSASQFVRFCETMGIPCREPPVRLVRLFEPGLIDECFLTHEIAFDSRRLADDLSRRITESKLDLRLESRAHVVGADDRAVTVAVGASTFRARFVFNCTYGELPFAGVALRAGIKRELTEMLLLRPPHLLAKVGVTVMDGPFFSTMPFPAVGLHSLSHVRYTPHWAVNDNNLRDLTPLRSNGIAMLREAAHFLPCLAAADPIRSIFEIKAILTRNEDDDGRPILIEQSEASPRIWSILGSKIDNIFDALDFIAHRDWTR
jgi:glycine/D-amino acid oxidase-like deaminating enzyme